MKTTEIGLRPSDMLYFNPPAIIPKVKTAGDIAISKKLWKAMYLSWAIKSDVISLYNLVEMFLKMHPKRKDAIENTARHFNVLMEIHYEFDTDEYDESIELNLEHVIGYEKTT